MRKIKQNSKTEEQCETDNDPELRGRDTIPTCDEETILQTCQEEIYNRNSKKADNNEKSV